GFPQAVCHILWWSRVNNPWCEYVQTQRSNRERHETVHVWNAPRRGIMSYKPRKLGHINIFVRNAERARAWYEDLLGLYTYGFTPGRAAFMTSDLGNSHEVALIEVGEDAAGPQKGQVGLNHMAWYMDSL